MCGILCVLGLSGPQAVQEARPKVRVLQKRLRHRGPDWSGTHAQSSAVLGHERLGIMDPESGDQPLLDTSGDVAIAVNGEIYNHGDLRKTFSDYKFKTGSDCEVILPLYHKHGEKNIGEWVSQLDGQFAFVLSDASKGFYMAARDPIGIASLYYGYGTDGEMWFASELKALKEQCTHFEQFPPGHFYDSRTKKFTPYFQPKWYVSEKIPTAPLVYAKIREVLTRAVEKRLMSDVPWGVLLSGGLDSSLVASIASRILYKRKQQNKTALVYPKMHSFSIGLEGSPDLAAARKVADFLQTVHHEMTFTVQDGLDAVRDVIYHLETYDVTTVRAATPMYLMSRKIKACGIKMVLSGEGADEVMAGYLYFHKAPSSTELFHETVRKLKDLTYFDCLRANKSTMAWGVEARVPFLDKDWLDLAMNLDPKHKMCVDDAGKKRMEKWVLRKAFDDKERPYLMDSVLWRQKEQFSDGVGYSWIDSLKAHANASVSDQQMKSAKHRFPLNTPGTKEAYFIRRIFEEHFPEPAARKSVPSPGGASASGSGTASIACSTAKAIEWDETFKKMAAMTNGECSGRAVMDVHESGYKAVPTTGISGTATSSEPAKKKARFEKKDE